MLVCALWLSSMGEPPRPDIFNQMQLVRRHLHANPELSNRERETQAFLKQALRDRGIEAEELAGTGLRCVIDTGRPGPTLAFRADIDALPIQEQTKLEFASGSEGVMHACGHDMHTAIAFGALIHINANPSDYRGRFVFLFQPAEEGPPPGEQGGASLMVAQGALEDPVPDVIFGLHLMPEYPAGSVFVAEGGVMARADRFHIRIIGKQTHGARPQEGVDALVAAAQVVVTSQMVMSRFKDPKAPAVLSFGKILAGNRFNIIPGEAELLGTIRSLDPELGDKVPAQLDQIIGGVTAALGATYEFENETMTPVTYNDPKWTERVRRAMQADGMQIGQAEPKMVAEDFGFFAEQVPGVYFFLGACDDPEAGCASVHTPFFNPQESIMMDGFNLWIAIASAFSGES